MSVLIVCCALSLLFVCVCEQKLPSTNSKLSYIYDEYMFHYIIEHSWSAQTDSRGNRTAAA